MSVIDDLDKEIQKLDEEKIDQAKLIDIKTKFVIAKLLRDINQQLYEISHYGIGTD